MHISQQYFKSGGAIVARRSMPSRHHDWSNTPDKAASFSVPLCFDYPRVKCAHSSEQPQRCSILYYSCTHDSMWQGRDRLMGGDQVALGVMAALEVLNEKKQSIHGKERHWHWIACFEERVCERALQRALNCLPWSSNHGDTGGLTWYRWCISSNSENSTASPWHRSKRKCKPLPCRRPKCDDTFSRTGSKYY